MLKDKVVIITGASSGIGLAAAKEFASHGCKVVMAARRLELLQETEKLISTTTIVRIEKRSINIASNLHGEVFI